MNKAEGKGAAKFGAEALGLSSDRTHVLFVSPDAEAAASASRSR